MCKANPENCWEPEPEKACESCSEGEFPQQATIRLAEERAQLALLVDASGLFPHPAETRRPKSSARERFAERVVGAPRKDSCLRDEPSGLSGRPREAGGAAVLQKGRACSKTHGVRDGLRDGVRDGVRDWGEGWGEGWCEGWCEGLG